MDGTDIRKSRCRDQLLSYLVRVSGSRLLEKLVLKLVPFWVANIRKLVLNKSVVDPTWGDNSCYYLAFL